MCRTARLVPSVVLLLAVCFLGTTQGSDDFDPIVRIEEDWYMQVGDPDSNVDGPQISCVISPRSNTNGQYAVFNINHQVNGDFDSGGLQLQIWNGEQLVTNRNHPSGNVLDTPDEEVRWTQVMQVDDGKLKFSVINGSSSTWGDFGTQGHLVAETQTSLQHLNWYSPSVSLSNSGVVFASNRVDVLRLERIRIRTQSGEVRTISISKNVE